MGWRGTHIYSSSEIAKIQVENSEQTQSIANHSIHFSRHSFMDFTLFFSPVFVPAVYLKNQEKIGSVIQCYHLNHTDCLNADLFIMGCEKDNEAIYETADSIRLQLYDLSLPHNTLRITDLGNLIAKDTKEETAEMLGYVLEKLMDVGKTVIILGSSREIAYGQSLAYRYNSDILPEADEKGIEYVYLSSSIDMIDNEITEEEESVNFRIFNQFPPRINGLTGVGMQKYRLTQSETHLMENLNFPILRYGEITSDIASAEPYFREAKAVCLDMSAIRHSESPGSNRPSPGGFSVMEICKLSKYAGASTINTFSLTEMNPEEDFHQQSTILAAMIVWYFCEGFYTKITENPLTHPANFKTYKVKLNTPVDEVIFYQSNLTERWWMEVVNKPNRKIVACTEKEYICTMKNELPERWWQVYNRLA